MFHKVNPAFTRSDRMSKAELEEPFVILFIRDDLAATYHEVEKLAKGS
jgi:hypothetical protein